MTEDEANKVLKFLMKRAYAKNSEWFLDKVRLHVNVKNSFNVDVMFIIENGVISLEFTDDILAVERNWSKHDFQANLWTLKEDFTLPRFLFPTERNRHYILCLEDKVTMKNLVKHIFNTAKSRTVVLSIGFMVIPFVHKKESLEEILVKSDLEDVA